MTEDKYVPELGVRVIAIDMDGTLCESQCFTEEECKNALPRQAVIDKVNELYKFKYVVINTARSYVLAEATLLWLDRHNVSYHAISFKKTQLHLLIDDKVMHVDAFLDDAVDVRKL